jgi:hypothetical protein
MQQILIFLVIGIMITTIINIGITSEIFAQSVEEDNSLSLSGQSIEEAQGNVTDLAANNTGLGEDNSLSLSGQSIEEANE